MYCPHSRVLRCDFCWNWGGLLGFREKEEEVVLPLHERGKHKQTNRDDKCGAYRPYLKWSTSYCT